MLYFEGVPDYCEKMHQVAKQFHEQTRRDSLNSLEEEESSTPQQGYNSFTQTQQSTQTSAL